MIAMSAEGSVGSQEHKHSISVSTVHWQRTTRVVLVVVVFAHALMKVDNEFY